ncbi:hypothetical protein N9O24_00390 [bacterium]|nr:hypothetical protein [bacterium]
MCNTHIGVYVGVSGSSFLAPGVAPRSAPLEPSVYAASGFTISILSGRLSFMLGFTGPNFPIDTACSSTLVALYCAASGMKLDECSRASVCGLGILEITGSLGTAAAGMTSPFG